MYHFKIRNTGRPADVKTDGQGVTTHGRRGEVCRFGSLVEAQECARMLASRRLLG